MEADSPGSCGARTRGMARYDGFRTPTGVEGCGAFNPSGVGSLTHWTPGRPRSSADPGLPAVTPPALGGARSIPAPSTHPRPRRIGVGIGIRSEPQPLRFQYQTRPQRDGSTSHGFSGVLRHGAGSTSVCHGRGWAGSVWTAGNGTIPRSNTARRRHRAYRSGGLRPRSRRDIPGSRTPCSTRKTPGCSMATPRSLWMRCCR